MTPAGESAGVVYCHAHLSAGASPGIKQCILMFGSLFLSPPQLPGIIASLRRRVTDELEKLDSGSDFDNVPVKSVVEALARSAVQSWFLEKEEERLDPPTEPAGSNFYLS
ncbi:hypothetical protein MN608_06702 [Microdochium nivale]|nr:hypothetical protein MN608_06702 [Microdochium nivale]